MKEHHRDFLPRLGAAFPPMDLFTPVIHDAFAGFENIFRAPHIQLPGRLRGRLIDADIETEFTLRLVQMLRKYSLSYHRSRYNNWTFSMESRTSSPLPVTAFYGPSPSAGRHERRPCRMPSDSKIHRDSPSPPSDKSEGLRANHPESFSLSEPYDHRSHFQRKHGKTFGDIRHKLRITRICANLRE